MYLCDVIKRAVLYQIFFAIAYYQFKAHEIGVHGYKERVYELANHLSLKHPILDQIFAHPHLVSQILIGIYVVSAALAIIGSRLGALVSAFALILDTAVHFHPLNPAKPGDITFGKFAFSHDLITRIAIILGILANTFRPILPSWSTVGKVIAGAAVASGVGAAAKGKKKN